MKTFLALLVLGSPALAEYLSLYASTAFGLLNTLTFDLATEELKAIQNLTDCGEHPTLALDRDNNKLYCMEDDRSYPVTKSKAGLIEFPISKFGYLEGILDRGRFRSTEPTTFTVLCMEKARSSSQLSTGMSIMVLSFFFFFDPLNKY